MVHLIIFISEGVNVPHYVIFDIPTPSQVVLVLEHQSILFREVYSVSQKKIPPWGVLTFFIFFTNGWEFLIDFLHTYHTFLSTLDYKLLFNRAAVSG